MRLNSKFNDIKLNVVKVLLIGIPSHSVAIFSKKIVCVVPTIAMMMIANSVEMDHTTSKNRIDAEDSLTEEEGAQQSKIAQKEFSFMPFWILKPNYFL